MINELKKRQHVLPSIIAAIKRADFSDAKESAIQAEETLTSIIAALEGNEMDKPTLDDLEGYEFDTSKYKKLDSGVKRCSECGRLAKPQQEKDHLLSMALGALRESVTEIKGLHDWIEEQAGFGDPYPAILDKAEQTITALEAAGVK